MKRFSLFLLCTISLLAFAGIASAQIPGDCYSTCNIEQDCATATDVCYECTRQWDDDECLEWRETTCQNVGACGQCTILSQWNQNSTGPWQFNKAVCWTDPNPDVVQESWLRPHYIDTYQRQRCSGVERVVMVARRLNYWQGCVRKGNRACNANDPRTGIGSPYNCPF